MGRFTMNMDGVYAEDPHEIAKVLRTAADQYERLGLDTNNGFGCVREEVSMGMGNVIATYKWQKRKIQWF